MTIPSMSLKVDDETFELLEEVGRKVPRGVLKRAALKGAKPLLEMMVQYAPVGPTGNLKRFLLAKMGRYKRSPDAFVAVERGKWAQGKMLRPGAPHDHLVAYGTVGRRYPRKKKAMKFAGYGPWEGQTIFAKSVAPMPKNTFVAFALMLSKPQVEQKITAHLHRYLLRRVTKMRGAAS